MLMAEIEAFLRPLKRVEGWDLSQTGAAEPDGIPQLISDQGGQRVGGIYASPALMPADGDMIAGHFSRSTLVTRFPDIKIMTILREPRTRVLSHWFYLRDYTDDTLESFGSWGPRLASARQPFGTFISSRDVACLTDNIITRLLLWPHQDIPDDDFIAPSSDERLIAQALERLREMDFVDVIENRFMRQRLFAWMEKTWRQTMWSRIERRVNGPLPSRANAARPPLFGACRAMKDELSGSVGTVLTARSRLDSVLWRRAVKSLDNADSILGQEHAYFEETCRRYDRLLLEM